MFSDYIANPEESFYYSFDHGPVHFVVLDSGEDKEDSHWAYSGLNDFDGYRSMQAEWLKEEIKSQHFKNAKWQIALSHMPLFGSGDGHGTLDCRRKWAPLLNEAKIDLHISGHTHRYGLLEPDAEHDYPIFIGGAPRKDRATLIRVDVNTETINVTMTTDAGKAVQKYKINN